MDYSDAIKILKEERKLYESDYCTPGDGTPDGTLLAAIDEGIAGLEMRTAKKPVFKTKELDNKKYYFKKEYYICPSCGKELVAQYHREFKTKEYDEVNRWQSGLARKHCDDCGQALDWTGMEKEE